MLDLAPSPYGLVADTHSGRKDLRRYCNRIYRYEERFLPGVYVLLAGLLGSAAIFALTLVMPNSQGGNRR